MNVKLAILYTLFWSKLAGDVLQGEHLQGANRTTYKSELISQLHGTTLIRSGAYLLHSDCLYLRFSNPKTCFNAGFSREPPHGHRTVRRKPEIGDRITVNSSMPRMHRGRHICDLLAILLGLKPPAVCGLTTIR